MSNETNLRTSLAKQLMAIQMYQSPNSFLVVEARSPLEVSLEIRIGPRRIRVCARAGNVPRWPRAAFEFFDDARGPVTVGEEGRVEGFEGAEAMAYIEADFI